MGLYRQQLENRVRNRDRILKIVILFAIIMAVIFVYSSFTWLSNISSYLSTPKIAPQSSADKCRVVGQRPGGVYEVQCENNGFVYVCCMPIFFFVILMVYIKIVELKEWFIAEKRRYELYRLWLDQTSTAKPNELLQILSDYRRGCPEIRILAIERLSEIKYTNALVILEYLYRTTRYGYQDEEKDVIEMAIKNLKHK
jgi:hypothetical protein